MVSDLIIARKLFASHEQMRLCVLQEEPIGRTQ